MGGSNGGKKGKGCQGTCIKDPWTKPKWGRTKGWRWGWVGQGRVGVGKWRQLCLNSNKKKRNYEIRTGVIKKEQVNIKKLLKIWKEVFVCVYIYTCIYVYVYLCIHKENKNSLGEVNNMLDKAEEQTNKLR